MNAGSMSPERHASCIACQKRAKPVASSERYCSSTTLKVLRRKYENSLHTVKDLQDQLNALQALDKSSVPSKDFISTVNDLKREQNRLKNKLDTKDNESEALAIIAEKLTLLENELYSQRKFDDSYMSRTNPGFFSCDSGAFSRSSMGSPERTHLQGVDDSNRSGPELMRALRKTVSKVERTVTGRLAREDTGMEPSKREKYLQRAVTGFRDIHVFLSSLELLLSENLFYHDEHVREADINERLFQTTRDNASLRHQINGLEARLAESGEQKGLLKANLEAAAAELEHTAQAIAQKDTAMQELKQTLAEKENEIAELKALVAEAHSTLTAQDLRVDEMDSNAREAARREDKWVTEIRELQAQCTRFQHIARDYQTTNTGLERKLLEAKRALADQEGTVRELKFVVAEQKDDLALALRLQHATHTHTTHTTASSNGPVDVPFEISHQPPPTGSPFRSLRQSFL